MNTNLSYQINQKRLIDHIHYLAEVGKIGETGVHRLAHSPEDVQGIKLVQKWMEEAGLKTRVDHFGNLIGRLEGETPNAPVLLLGSHIDSQPYGGRFDGPVGVLGALESIQTLMESNTKVPFPIEVIAFADEEGSRFNKGLFGSRGIIGEVEEAELDRADENNVARKQALKEMGCNPDKLQDSIYDITKIRAFLEMHIEQGPILEQKDKPVGIVTGISGPLWMTVTLTGFAGHSGSVPMQLRQDALLGASEAVVKLNEIVRSHAPAPTVGTVGNMKIFPNSRNIIAEQVSFTIDLRDIDNDRRNNCEKELLAALDEISSRHQLEMKIQEDTRSEPRYCAEWMQDIMEEEAGTMDMDDIPKLMSGPFHDALPLSKVCDFGMIFVRCYKGISHNPMEYSSNEDIIKGTELYYKTVKRIIELDS